MNEYSHVSTQKQKFRRKTKASNLGGAISRQKSCLVLIAHSGLPQWGNMM